MRILVVSNLYPPHHVGGYELGCRDVVRGLQARGHDVAILTSDFRLHTDVADEPGVNRILKFLPDGKERHDKFRECWFLVQKLRDHRVEVVYFWNQTGLCFWLPMVARRLGWPVAFFLSDTSFVSWRVAAWLAGVAAKNGIFRFVFGQTFLARGYPIVEKQTCHFASHFLKDCAVKAHIAIAPKTSTVAYWGIDPQLFVRSGDRPWPPRRLLFAGQLIPQKGVHTAIAAFGLLAKDSTFNGLRLTIAGGGLQPDYERGLRILPAQFGIADRVDFLGKVPRADLPRIYSEHDVLLFPSEWEEPFAITPLEAMTAGLVVVGTVTGGSGELFRDRETAMTFTAGDANDCARAIRELIEDRSLWESISCKGRQEVLAKHILDSMVDRIEASLLQVVRGNRHSGRLTALSRPSPGVQ
jgi:glycosyltransferase involved in cell wall biosynthesis